MLIGKTSTVAVPRDLYLNHRPALPRSTQRAVIVYYVVFSWKRLRSVRTGEKMFSLLLHGFYELCCAWVGAHRGRSDPQLVASQCLTTAELLSPSKKLGHFVQIGELLVVADGRVTPLFELREDPSSLHRCNKHWGFTLNYGCNWFHYCYLSTNYADLQ